MPAAFRSKPAEKMDEMKMDMAGGAAVLGHPAGAARLKLQVEPGRDHPGGGESPLRQRHPPRRHSHLPLRQDHRGPQYRCRGRLILADALTYAQRYQPRADDRSGHPHRRLRHRPRPPRQRRARQHHGPWSGSCSAPERRVANASGNCRSGTITPSNSRAMWPTSKTPAAARAAPSPAPLSCKPSPGFPWAHLDIAGTAWEEKGRPYAPSGGTGVGVRLLMEYLNKKPL